MWVAYRVGYSNQFPFIPFIISDEVIGTGSSIFGVCLFE